tara:strand:- start:135 stop:593 length:459 start_codon:yes stop_codon:yes gene_type:complete
MMFNKRKKQSRMRGSHTHGGGSKKKRRGAGNRGGRGLAGTGKRGDCKKPLIWHTKYFGKSGFKKKNASTIKTINIEDLCKLINKGLIEKKGDNYNVDLKKVGYDKLLGKGKVSEKLSIKARFASENAIKKIQAAGGLVTLQEESLLKQGKTD